MIKGEKKIKTITKNSPSAPILIINLNPGFQKTLVLSELCPGEVNRIYRAKNHISGKGINVARMIKQNGGSSHLLTQVYPKGSEKFLNQAKKEELKLHTVPSGSNGHFRTCTTIIDQTANQSTELVEPGAAVDREAELEILHSFLSWCPARGVVVMTGSKASGFTKEIFPTLCKMAAERENHLILDIRGDDLKNCLNALSVNDHADTKTVKLTPKITLKINLAEFFHTFQQDFLPVENKSVCTHIQVGEQTPFNKLEPDLQLLLQNTKDLYPWLTMILSHGSTGVITYGYEARHQNVPQSKDDKCKIILHSAHEAKVVNPIGCGDGLTAGIALGYSRNLPFTDTIQLALDIAAKNLSVLTPGSTVEIESL